MTTDPIEAVKKRDSTMAFVLWLILWWPLYEAWDWANTFPDGFIYYALKLPITALAFVHMFAFPFYKEILIPKIFK